jgi:3-hydroxyacyl-CoA dehydrogenase/enoyl-CoA hydratase/3-hydroxybutyryl-CoA epimerase
MAEAAFLMQEGQEIELVDRVYVKTFGMPMGPFALMDEVGLDVCLKVLKIFKKAFGERIEIAPSMIKLESLKNRLGKKSGLGFYKYNEKGYRTEVDRAIYSELDLSTPSNPLSSEACIERGIFAMINECARAMVSDQIVYSAAEVDLAMIMGTGFPPFRGGLLRYADHLGIQLIVEKLEQYGKTASRLRVSEELKTVLSRGGFYSMFPAS